MDYGLVDKVLKGEEDLPAVRAADGPNATRARTQSALTTARAPIRIEQKPSFLAALQ